MHSCRISEQISFSDEIATVSTFSKVGELSYVPLHVQPDELETRGFAGRKCTTWESKAFPLQQQEIPLGRMAGRFMQKSRDFPPPEKD